MKLLKKLVVVILLCGLLLIYFRFPHGKRPMFSSWEEGHTWWSWHRDLVIDDERKELLIDVHLNILLLIKPPAQPTLIEDQADGTRIIMSASREREVFIHKVTNILFIFSDTDGLSQQAIPAGLAECMLGAFPNPYGYSELSITDCLGRCCAQNCEAIRAAVKK